jgi:hypothetical protein
MMGLPRIVNAVPAFASRREAFQTALGETYEALAMAFNDLRQIQRLEADENAPALDRAKAYENLYGHLWQAYKDRVQKLIRALGYDIGFLVQKDAVFEKGAANLLEHHPELGDLVVGAENSISLRNQLIRRSRSGLWALATCWLRHTDALVEACSSDSSAASSTFPSRHGYHWRRRWSPARAR